MTVDFRKFRFNSRMPMDNVVFAYEATLQNIVSSGYSAFDTTIEHKLGFTPLAFGIFSTNNGASWRDIDFQIGQASGGSTFSDGTNIYADILLEQYYSSIKIRIFAFQPSDVTANVTPPQPLSKFYLNTNNSYDALIATGVYQGRNTSSEQLVYAHNLGYIPRVMIWTSNDIENVRFSQANTFISSGQDYEYIYPIITTSELKLMFNNTFGEIPPLIHYRIYGRENG